MLEEGARQLLAQESLDEDDLEALFAQMEAASAAPGMEHAA